MSTSGNRYSLASSWDSLDFDDGRTRSVRTELSDIRTALDFVTNNLLTQQYQVSREFEDRVRGVYDDVINDINGIRQKVNSLGDLFVSGDKFKTWVPMAPIRKECLRNIYEIERPRKLKSSKSVDFVDVKDNEKVFVKYLDRHRSIASSRSSLASIASSGQRSHKVPGYGCCFKGDQTDSSTYVQRPKNPRHSWGPSRSGSRADLDHSPGCHDNDLSPEPDPDDWRMKVAPYMWDGWKVPDISRDHLTDLRARLAKVEEIRHEIISIHNEYRRRHGCPDLSETPDLSRDAQQWAEVTASKGYAQYSDSRSRGENILVTDITPRLTGRDIVDTWYRQSRLYNYKLARWQRGTSNFTQMIWKESRTIGVGMAKFESQDTFVIVVQYWPPGNNNMSGQFSRNVPVPVLALIDGGSGNDMKPSGNTGETVTGTLEDARASSCIDLNRSKDVRAVGEHASDANRRAVQEKVLEAKLLSNNGELEYEIMGNCPISEKISGRPESLALCGTGVCEDRDVAYDGKPFENLDCSLISQRIDGSGDSKLVDKINSTEATKGIGKNEVPGDEYNHPNSQSKNEKQNVESSSVGCHIDEKNVTGKDICINTEAVNNNLNEAPGSRDTISDDVGANVNQTVSADILGASSEAYKSPVEAISFQMQCDGVDTKDNPSTALEPEVKVKESCTPVLHSQLDEPFQSQSTIRIFGPDVGVDTVLDSGYEGDADGSLDPELIDSLLDEIVAERAAEWASAKRTSYQTEYKAVDLFDDSET